MIKLDNYKVKHHDRFANLGVRINEVANEIARKTRRGTLFTLTSRYCYPFSFERVNGVNGPGLVLQLIVNGQPTHIEIHIPHHGYHVDDRKEDFFRQVYMAWCYLEGNHIHYDAPLYPTDKDTFYSMAAYHAGVATW